MVSLVHVAPPKHFVEPYERFGSACENHKATHGTIESVHGAEKDFAGFVVLLFDIGFDLVGQRPIAGFVALNDFAGGLVDNDHVIVFVEDFHRGENRMKIYGGRERKSRLVRTVSRQLRELSRTEGQNESGKVAQVFAALTFQPYEGLLFCAFCQVELEKQMRSDVFFIFR